MASGLDCAVVKEFVTGFLTAVTSSDNKRPVQQLMENK